MRAACTLLLGALACSGGNVTGDAGDAAGEAECACADVDVAPLETTVFVLGENGTAIAGFPISSTGDAAPTTRIAGDQTNLDGALALAVDKQGFLYAAVPLAILVFAPGTTGNAPPARSIAGPNALAATDSFVGVTVASDGTIFAASELGSGVNRNPKILSFSNTANGNVAPIRTITGPTTTMQAVLSLGVFLNQVAVGDSTQHVLFFHYSDSGDVAPQRALNDGPGIVESAIFDRVGAIYLARFQSGSSSVISFIAGAQGTPTPLLDITGPTTKLTAAAGVAVDSSGTAYVSNADPGGASIFVYDAAATGDAAPIRTISGPSTTLSGDLSQFPMPLVVF